ncbi:MAG: SAM-dependent methyltransferase [Dehalococcoidia bacterium]|nr:SAM-dependent methyltransferase [Dehalococcoidia bacterium]
MEKLSALIRDRIRAEGPIPFAVFMEMALYYPGLGYYASGTRRTGASGDFYTSPQAHPVFGALLALQLERMWQIMGCPSRFQVVEPGAGEGLLARDVVRFSQGLRSGFADALYYVAVDLLPAPDVPLTDQGGAAPPPRSVASRSLPFHNLRGCILSNELLDAFPVHRLVVRGGVLREVHVNVKGETFEEVLGDLSSPVQDLLEVKDDLPPEGSRLELCPSAWVWMVEVARALESGFVLTIDYGYGEATGEDTLASYRRHSVSSPYENVGDQDLTAQVDFGAALEAGRRAGLRTVGLSSQRRLLLGLGLGAFQEASARLHLPQKEHQANQMAMLDLVRPEGLGSFLVMVQCKAVSGVGLSDLAPERPARERLAAGDLATPVLGLEHMPLLEGRYPSLEWQS